MTNLKGGYILINKNDAIIYALVEIALTSGKPILWYEDATTCYYIDTISKSGDDLVLTKGGKTITITSSNVITENGSIQPISSLNLYLVDYYYYNDDNGNEQKAKILLSSTDEITRNDITKANLDNNKIKLISFSYYESASEGDVLKYSCGSCGYDNTSIITDGILDSSGTISLHSNYISFTYSALQTSANITFTKL